MTHDDELEREAEDVASWLRAHAARFVPLRIVRVDPDLIVDESGDLAIELTVILEDPDSPDEGWPVDATFGLYTAVLERAGEAPHGMWAYVHLQAVSSNEAA